MEDPSSEEEERLSRLLAETGEGMAKLARLSSDDIAEFQKMAELTNDYASRLDARSAALLVKHMPTGFVATPWGDIALRRWARDERAAAAEWMATHPDPSPVASSALVQGWFSRDPEALAAYVAALPAGPWRTNVATAAVEDALAAEKPGDAVAFLDLGAGDNPRRSELQEWTAIQWGRANRDAASTWAARETDPVRRERLLAAVNIGHANMDPLSAAETLLAQVKTPEIATEALGSIVRIWSAKEPEVVARWIAGFPSGPEKTASTAQLLAVWSATEPAAAARWASSLEDEGDRRRAESVLTAMKTEYAP